MVRLSSSSSVDTLPPFQHYSSSSFTSTPSSSSMSDIYTHDPVQDFTNPFLDFDQGYVRPFATVLPAVKATLIPIPSEDESVLPKKPLTRKEIKTRRGYPRGESQGESSGKILLPSFIDLNVEESSYRIALFQEDEGAFPFAGREGSSGQTFVCLSLQSGWRVVQEGQWGKTLSFSSIGEESDDD